MDKKIDRISVINFADSKVPEFKELTGREYIGFGEDNNYPQYLIHLFNKCAKHAAIVKAKVMYITGNGAKPKTETPEAAAFKLKVNAHGETLDELLIKTCFDIELHGGFYWQIIRDNMGRVKDIYHVDFSKVRVNKDHTKYFYCKNWNKTYSIQDEITPYDRFDSEKVDQSTGIFCYKEYTPGDNCYPLPGYKCLNYIETDIEISKFHLSGIRNGLMPSKLIEFFTGVPNDEAKMVIEKKMKNKYSGSENAGSFMLLFNEIGGKSVNVQDISSNDLDKQFEILNKTCTQEIFIGHSVTTPGLLGVLTEGKLGSSTELREGYEIFKNTYINTKQRSIEKVLNYFSVLMGLKTEWEFIPVEPLGFTLENASLVQVAPRSWLLEKLGIDPNIYADAAPGGTMPAVAPIDPNAPIPEQAMVNDNVKNLTAKQHQQLMRIIRQYTKGQLNIEQATALLRTGLGLSDTDISAMLGVEQKMSKKKTEIEAAELFETVGRKRDGLMVVDSFEADFQDDVDMQLFEMGFETFKNNDQVDANILAQIKKDPKISPETIAKVLDIPRKEVARRLAVLTQSGGLIQSVNTLGEIERTLERPISDLTPNKPETVSVEVMYSYERRPNAGDSDLIETSRPFCVKLITLDRLYTRVDIESITDRLGYSVFDRAGGFWNHNGKTDIQCRHYWKANIVVKKEKK